MNPRPQEQFRDAIIAAGMTPPDNIKPGRFLRFPGEGKSNGNKAGWCKLFDDERGGIYGDFATGAVENWQAKQSRQFTPAERKAFQRNVAEARAKAEHERKAENEQAARTASERWAKAKPADPAHPYIVRKCVPVYGIRQEGDTLLIPMRDSSGKLWNVERIETEPDTPKKGLHGGRREGCYHSIGIPHGVICVCEGYATGATTHEATGHAVAVAFNAGNVPAVARDVRAKHPDYIIIICADDDYRTPGNPGLTKAMEAARAVGGLVAVPNFAADRPEGATDFNDLILHAGADAVKRSIANARVPDVSDRQTGAFAAPGGDCHARTDGAALLDTVLVFLRRFVVYPSEHAAVAHALWIAHTHLMDEWESTPRLAFLSPEPGSGKTRALEVSETLVPRPIASVNATPAYLFRKVSDPDGRPTILYDEIDTLFGPKAKDNEEVRGLINAGHRRGATAGRCVVRGKIIDTEELPAYCAVALAGLGNLPDTIISRSVVVRMRRRAPAEHVDPYRVRVHAPEGSAIRESLVTWALGVNGIGTGYPAMPDGVTDRAADVWEPLLAVADAVGGDWPNRARVAAVALVALSMAGTPSLGIRLLSDLRTVFGNRDAMFSEDIVHDLCNLEEAPWGDIKGKAISQRTLANLLRDYGVRSKDVRLGELHKKGYARVDLHDPWSRYLGPPANGSATSATSATSAVDGEAF